MVNVVRLGAWGTKSLFALVPGVKYPGVKTVNYPGVRTPGDGALQPEKSFFLGVEKVQKGLEIWSGCNQMLRNKK